MPTLSPNTVLQNVLGLAARAHVEGSSAVTAQLGQHLSHWERVPGMNPLLAGVRQITSGERSVEETPSQLLALAREMVKPHGPAAAHLIAARGTRLADLVGEEKTSGPSSQLYDPSTNGPVSALVEILWETLRGDPWFEAFMAQGGSYQAPFLGQNLLLRVAEAAVAAGVQTIVAPRAADPSQRLTTPYLNTILRADEPTYPGDLEIERRIESFVRWNALAMVAKANKDFAGLGGHMATYQSAATLYEVAFQHFFRGRGEGTSGDLIYFQGHASPGIYARAFLEGRLTEGQLKRFRREIGGQGLSSYPHPWLMPNFWEAPTVSMGLGPIGAIQQARYNRYLASRGLAETGPSKIWAFLGDGEMDEVESRGALHGAANEGLDNLIFVINCNLQRLDGPVRGNGKIVQELESGFRGAGWNVVKLLWGGLWDGLLENDPEGLILSRLAEVTDGQLQTYAAKGGDYFRDHFFGEDPRLLERVAHLSDNDLKHLIMNRGGHDPQKVHAAYRRAMEHRDQPTVILAQTIKGYGLTEGAGRMTAHQKKKVSDGELASFRDQFEVPVSDGDLKDFPLLRFEEGSRELDYLRERRDALGGFVPARRNRAAVPLTLPASADFEEFLKGSGGRPVSTTMAVVSILSKLLRHPEFGRHVVPIIPDEGRTFGMDPLFSQVGVYNPKGQLYEPADKGSVMYYREAPNGQILQEGISEAGSMATFTAAATSYSTHGVPTVPFYIFYSMFGPQRTGDQIWAVGDMRGRGFLIGATSGRTTLNGEGLQHEDGHSPLLTSTVPNLLTYHPSFAFELAVIIEDGLKKMHGENQDVFYYLTVHNENLAMPAMPEGAREGILKGLYRFSPAATAVGSQEDSAAADILASDAIMGNALRAQKTLAEKYGVAADVWSVTSYTELRREALECERWNLLHPDQEPRIPHVTQVLSKHRPAIAVSDWMKAVPDQIERWVPGGLLTLGTDGFGRSDTREALREHFEVNEAYIVYSVLFRLSRQGRFPRERLMGAQRELGIDPEKPYPPKI